MEKYKGYLISGTAQMIHPFNPDSYPSGTVCRQGQATSLVEVARFELPKFTMRDWDLAAFFGLELARMVVDDMTAHPWA